MSITPRKATGWRRVVELFQDETVGVHPRLMALNLALGLLPRHQAGEARHVDVGGGKLGGGFVFSGALVFRGVELEPALGNRERVAGDLAGFTV